MLKKIILLFVFLLLIANLLIAKEAVLLVGGMFSSPLKMKKMVKYFAEEFGYDTYWIDYLRKKGWDISKEILINEIDKVPLEEYDKVYIFCHIFGGRMLLEYFNDYKIDNLKSIVFDRGPIEEELGIAAREKSGDWALLIAGGKSILEFTYKESFKIPQNLKDVKIGVIIETGAIPLCYLYKKEIIKGNPSFDVNDIFERSDDHYYIPLNHKQMYVKNDIFGPEIHHFFQNGEFSGNVNRELKDYLAEF